LTKYENKISYHKQLPRGAICVRQNCGREEEGEVLSAGNYFHTQELMTGYHHNIFELEILRGWSLVNGRV
jgi:hypothetical protein